MEVNMEYERYMKQAIEEAKSSLREGNNGFGAVIVKDGAVIAASQDREDTDADPTSHAEINAIRETGKILGKDYSGCILVSTHEPCPMCAYAIVWAKIPTVVYGFPIADAIKENRRRINQPCKQIFEDAGAAVDIIPGVLKEECSMLYRADVRNEIRKLRGIDDAGLKALCADSVARRVEWFQRRGYAPEKNNVLQAAYELFLDRLNITEDGAPIVEKTETQIRFHSQNYCPTLETCKILGLDTRYVCRAMNESSMDALLKQLDSRLSFSRNYEKLRPYADYCEEMISLATE
jgi:tRNA(Arg) A34 adenosine deaminase TadA